MCTHSKEHIHWYNAKRDTSTHTYTHTDTHTHTHTPSLDFAFPPPPHAYCLQSSNYNASTAVNYLRVLFYTSTYNCQNLIKKMTGRHVAEVVCLTNFLQYETVISITHRVSNFSQALILLLRGHPGSAEPGPGCRQLAPVPACWPLPLVSGFLTLSPPFENKFIKWKQTWAACDHFFSWVLLLSELMCLMTTSVNIQKTRYKKLFTHVESHASAMNLLESGE